MSTKQKLFAEEIALRICGEIPKEEEMFKIRFRKKRNQFTDLIDLYTAEFPARREEEPEVNAKEVEMPKCLICGCDMQYKTPYSGRPLINDPGVVCYRCWREKVLPYEQELKASVPDSIRYYPYPSDVEED